MVTLQPGQCISEPRGASSDEGAAPMGGVSDEGVLMVGREGVEEPEGRTEVWAVSWVAMVCLKDIRDWDWV